VVQRNALQLLGIRGWRSKAANRDEWRRLMKEATARKGLLRHIWMDGSKSLCAPDDYNTESYK
jgi:hypothetical protein